MVQVRLPLVSSSVGEEDAFLRRATQEAETLCHNFKNSLSFALDGEVINGTPPIDVPAGSTLIVAACDYNNVVTKEDYQVVSEKQSYVGNVGAGAKVYVHVKNSNNVRIAGRFLLGKPLGSGLEQRVASKLSAMRSKLSSQTAERRALGRQCATQVTENFSSREDFSIVDSEEEKPRRRGDKSERENPEWLLAPVVRGKIGHGAYINIQMTHSANVYMTSKVSEVQLNNAGALLGELVLSGTIEQATVKVNVHDSANVRGGGSVLIRQGSLMAPTISSQSYHRSKLHVHVSRSANVDSRALTLLDDTSVLLNPLVLAADLPGSASHIDISVAASSVANAKAQELFMNEGSFLAPAFVELSKVDVLAASSINVNVDASANARVGGFVFGAGTLIGRGVGLSDSTASNVAVDLVSSGNLRATAHDFPDTDRDEVFVAVGRVLSIGEVSNSNIHVVAREIAIARVDQMQLHVVKGLALHVVSVLGAVSASSVEVSAYHSFNWYGRRLMIDRSRLLAEALHMRFGASDSTTSVRVGDVANVYGGKDSVVCIGFSGLVRGVAGFGSALVDSRTSVVVHDLANIYASHVDINSRSKKASGLVYAIARLMGTDSQNKSVVLSGGALTVTAKQCANLQVSSMVSMSQAILMSHVVVLDGVVERSSLTKLEARGSASITTTELLMKESMLVGDFLNVHHYSTENLPHFDMKVANLAQAKVVSASISSQSGLIGTFVGGGTLHPKAKVSVYHSAVLESSGTRVVVDDAFLLGHIQGAATLNLVMNDVGVARGRVQFAGRSRACASWVFMRWQRSFPNSCLPRPA
eukprot:TRINITY_DN1417_c0_g1_i1.p1 TRINITY_DN1417_c0_g1~~TRINITY_DN1417_c0_g1_i1.p1  ORF type:complete len:873 (-),score=135.24 TRINITY_DN1417_c0_g1_i1:415-2856(-)